MGRTILIRHASTAANSSEVVRSTNDIPLDDKGANQAVNTGHKLHDIPIHKILTSNMSRAKTTAKVISSLNSEKPNVKSTSELNPINWGNFTGKKVAAVQPQLDQYLKNPKRKIPGGGIVQKVIDNARKVITPLINNSDGQNTAIVMHHSHFLALPHILDPKKSLIQKNDLVPPGGAVELVKSGDKVNIKKL